MKRFLLLIFILISVFVSGSGQNISEKKAIRIASNFLFGRVHPVESVTLYGNEGRSSVYVVNFVPEGWVLVSGNEDARPVIGYSYEGSFNVHDVSWNVKSWLDYQVIQITNAQTDSKWTEEWKILQEGKLPVLKSAVAVDPMLETEWDQDAGWNRFCPPYEDGPNGKAYVGCVAVAMAQALHHLKYPERPTGEKSYQLAPYGTIRLNFDEEPEYEWSKMSLTSPDDYNAQLLYHCAVAVEMDFGGEGSGAYTTRVPFAFQRYFGFTPSVKTISRGDNDDEWIASLKSELDNDNVLIYSGDPGISAAGHAFNIDGYSASGYFHFNWGWSGRYNGYFSINDITPGDEDFTHDQKAVVGISKPYWGPTDIILSNQSIKENMPAGTVVGDISIIDYSEDDRFTIEVFGPPLFLEDSYAPAKFYEENMQLKSLEPLSAGPYPEVATIRVTDSDDNVFEERFEITVIPVSSAPNTIESGNLIVYPNPANNIIYIEGFNELNYYRITDIYGKSVLFSDKYNRGIDVSKLQNGIYFLEFSGSGKGRYIQKIIVQK